MQLTRMTYGVSLAFWARQEKHMDWHIKPAFAGC
jgi:hypothetical protein